MVSVPLLPEVASADVVLVRRHVLGGPSDHRVSGQISIGRSEAMRLRPDSAGLDGELVQAVARDAEDQHYYLIWLSCTFRASSAPVMTARLSVALRQEPAWGVPEPVVWSMDPLRASTPVTHRRTRRFGPNVKIPEIVGVDAATEHVWEFTSELCHIVAEGEGESQVEWTFTSTAATDLMGVHRLSLIARTSAQIACRAELALSATRREKWFGLVPYGAEIPPQVATIPLSGR